MYNGLSSTGLMMHIAHTPCPCRLPRTERVRSSTYPGILSTRDFRWSTSITFRWIRNGVGQANFRRSFQKSRSEIELCAHFFALRCDKTIRILSKGFIWKKHYQISFNKFLILCRKLFYASRFPKMYTFSCFRRSKHNSHLAKRLFIYRNPFDSGLITRTLWKTGIPENDSPL